MGGRRGHAEVGAQVGVGPPSVRLQGGKQMRASVWLIGAFFAT